jgi:hypothetical protein
MNVVKMLEWETAPGVEGFFKRLLLRTDMYAGAVLIVLFSLVKKILFLLIAVIAAGGSNPPNMP